MKVKLLYFAEDGEPELLSAGVRLRLFLVHPEPWALLAALHPKSETMLVLSPAMSSCHKTQS